MQIARNERAVPQVESSETGNIREGALLGVRMETVAGKSKLVFTYEAADLGSEMGQVLATGSR